MHVPSAWIILILSDMLLGLAVPIILAVFFRKKYGAAVCKAAYPNAGREGESV